MLHVFLARDAQAKLALIVAQCLSMHLSLGLSVRDSLSHAHVRRIARREPRRLPACYLNSSHVYYSLVLTVSDVCRQLVQLDRRLAKVRCTCGCKAVAQKILRGRPPKSAPRFSWLPRSWHIMWKSLVRLSTLIDWPQCHCPRQAEFWDVTLVTDRGSGSADSRGIPSPCGAPPPVFFSFRSNIRSIIWPFSTVQQKSKSVQRQNEILYPRPVVHHSCVFCWRLDKYCSRGQ